MITVSGSVTPDSVDDARVLIQRPRFIPSRRAGCQRRRRGRCASAPCDTRLVVADNAKPIYTGEFVEIVTVDGVFIDGTEYTVEQAEALRDEESGELRNEIDAGLKALRVYQRGWPVGLLLAARLQAWSAGGQATTGLPISHSWPNGSLTRPTCHPCSVLTADFSTAPAASALDWTASGSLTRSRILALAVPDRRGTTRSELSPTVAIQKTASSMASCATRSSPSPTWWSSLAPNARW